MRAAVVGGLLAFLGVFSGCASLGERLRQESLPPGAPSAGEVLAGLAANEEALKGFRATGTVIIQSPELESTQISRESSITFRPPLDLHVVGRKYGTRFVELTCSGPSFLIVLPTEKQFYYRPDGEKLHSVSTSQMAREMFQPEDWRDIPERRVRVAAYDQATQTATLQIFRNSRDKAPHRILVVRGTPWVVLENHLLDGQGNELAITSRSDYYSRDGALFPRRVESEFPGEDARMSFTMRRIDFGPVADDTVFDIGAKLSELKKRSYRQVDTLRGGGTAGAAQGDTGDWGYVDNFIDDEGMEKDTR